MKQTKIAHGAEATLYKQDGRIIKKRVKKSYRHQDLDHMIRKRRTKQEARLLIKAKESGAHVPHIYNLNKKQEPVAMDTLEIEYIDGETLAATLNTHTPARQKQIMQNIAHEVATLHDADIIHGDLTTSNMLLCKNTLYIIDFGLGFIAKRIEDKAVDIHLLKEALYAKHWEHADTLFEVFTQAYNPKEKINILKRLTAVERRGRNKKGS